MVARSVPYALLSARQAVAAAAQVLAVFTNL
jgi:hypothetical protein